MDIARASQEALEMVEISEEMKILSKYTAVMYGLDAGEDLEEIAENLQGLYPEMDWSEHNTLKILEQYSRNIDPRFQPLTHVYRGMGGKEKKKIIWCRPNKKQEWEKVLADSGREVKEQLARLKIMWLLSKDLHGLGDVKVPMDRPFEESALDHLAVIQDALTGRVQDDQPSSKMDLSDDLDNIFERSIGEEIDGLLRIEASGSVGEMEEDIPDGWDESRAVGLSHSYTFKNYVVDPDSRQTVDKLRTCAMKPGILFNPLLIYGGVGLGKTHLLHASGNLFLAENKSGKVFFINSEDLAKRFVEAVESMGLAELRREFEGYSYIMIDDIQMLGEREGLIDELGTIFGSLVEKEVQIVMTSDRPIEEIRSVHNSLIRPFDAGSALALNPPTKPTKIEILKNHAHSEGYEVPQEVYEFLSQQHDTNVRHIMGLLKKVVAHAFINSDSVTLDVARDALVTPGKKKKTVKKRGRSRDGYDGDIMEKLHLEMGMGYLVEEERANFAFELFEYHFKKIGRGMILTRTNPSIIKRKYDIEGADVFWLTDRKTKIPTIYPRLETMKLDLKKFYAQGEDGVLMVDGIEYLLSLFGNSSLLRFVRDLNDEISLNPVILLVPFSPMAINVQDANMLRREIEVLSLMGK